MTYVEIKDWFKNLIHPNPSRNSKPIVEKSDWSVEDYRKKEEWIYLNNPTETVHITRSQLGDIIDYIPRDRTRQVAKSLSAMGISYTIDKDE